MVSPVCRPSQRITTLDVLQGLVLLGLLIDQAYGQQFIPRPGHHHSDLPVHFIGLLLVSGQFDRMGSFLFGLLAYQCGQHADRSESTVAAGAVDGPGRTDARLDGPGLDGHDQSSPYRIIQRLLLLLLGIGLSLSLLLRSVNLLVQYAGLGFTLLYARNQSVESLLAWIVGVAVLTILIETSLGLFHPVVMVHQLHGFSLYLSYELLMLGGLLVGKLGLLHQNLRLRVRLSLVQVWVLPVAFLLKGAWVALALGLVTLPQPIEDYQPGLLALCGFLGSLLLTLVYILDVGLNARLTSSGWAGWLGRVGQLGLTNYALQSILCPLLLYGYGVLVPGTLPIWGRAGIVVGIYGFQIGFSQVWSKRYQHGPLEWVCRHWLHAK